MMTLAAGFRTAEAVDELVGRYFEECRKWDICESNAYAAERAEHPDPDAVELSLIGRVRDIAREAGLANGMPVAVMTPTWLVVVTPMPRDDGEGEDEWSAAIVRRSAGLVVLV